jgi:hypothetical protein
MNKSNNGKHHVRSEIIKSYLHSWINKGILPEWANKPSYESVVARNAFIATKNFHDLIVSHKATVDGITDCLQEMRKHTAQFEKLYEIPWPL